MNHVLDGGPVISADAALSVPEFLLQAFAFQPLVPSNFEHL